MAKMSDVDKGLADITCSLVTAALIQQGVDPVIAATVGKKACQPAAEVGYRKARKSISRTAKKGVKSVKKSKAMKEAQKKARLKSGKFRKGWGKSKLMKEYHRILKRLK